MITKITAFRATDGTMFETIEQVKRHDLRALLGGLGTPEFVDATTDHVLKNSDKVVDILTSQSNSKPTARKINGGTKVYKPRSEKSKSKAAAKAAADALLASTSVNPPAAPTNENPTTQN